MTSHYLSQPWPGSEAHDIDGLVQDCSNSSVLAMELLQSCFKPSTSVFMPHYVKGTITQGLDIAIYDFSWIDFLIIVNLFPLQLLFAQICFPV